MKKYLDSKFSEEEEVNKTEEEVMINDTIVPRAENFRHIGR